MDKAIKVNNLSKKYDNDIAIDKVSFDIEKGKVVGLLGPSGSGKSTIIRILAGLVKADSGSFEIFNHNFNPKINNNVIYKVDDLVIEEKLGIMDFINLYDDFYKSFSPKNTLEILEYLNIDHKTMVCGMSKGERQKFHLAMALANDGDIYLLDEIFDGLDPISTSKVMDLLIDRIDGEKTFILASQQLKLVENLLDEVIFLDNGKIHYKDSVLSIDEKEKVGISEFYDKIYLG